MSQSIPLLTLSKIASGVIAAERFTTYAGAQAGAAANTQGVARSAASIGEAYPVDVIGTATVESGAAVANGAAIETDASGRAITRTSGPTVARALQAATAAGQRIEVLLIPN